MSTNLTQLIQSVPSVAAKRYMFMKLNGSCSWRVCGLADRLATRLIGEYGEDFKLLTPREVEAVCQGPETGPQGSIIDEGRLMYRMAGEWRALMLRNTIATTGAKDDDFGTISSSLARMCTVPMTPTVNQKGVADLEKIGIITTEEDKLVGLRRKAAENYARMQEAAKRRGASEWIIDHLFASTDEADEVFVELDELTQEFFIMKAEAAAKDGVAVATENARFNERKQNLDLGDIVFLRDLQTTLNAVLNGTYEEPAPKPAVRRVRKNVTA